jgi:hypothetical protein
MNPMAKLPPKFKELEEQFGDWILPTHQDHALKRGNSTLAELTRLYEGIDPYLEAMLDYMDQYPLDQQPDDAKNLWLLICAYIEIAQAVERWQAPKQPEAIDNVRIRRVINHDSSALII